jgi:hypothetical protein
VPRRNGTSLWPVRAGPLLLVAAIAAALSACGGSGGEPGTTSTASRPSLTTITDPVQGELPPGAEGPEDTAEDSAGGPAATEASPEATATGPQTGELAGADEEAVTQAVRLYIDALDRHDAAQVCGLLEPGSLRLSDLPVRRAGCRASLAASIGYRRPGGTPAWRRTEIVELKSVSVEGGGARVTATVTHRFADRKYTSVEEDVIYLDHARGRWLIAKPSGTLYRAVGYPQAPLRALTPP